MSFNADLDMQRLEEQIYYFCPSLHYCVESKKEHIRIKLCSQLQESLPKVNLEKYQVHTLLVSIEKNLQKCKDFGIIRATNKLNETFENRVQTMIIKTPQLSDSSCEDEDFKIKPNSSASKHPLIISSDGTSATDFESDLPLALRRTRRKRKHKCLGRFTSSPFQPDKSCRKSQQCSNKGMNLSDVSDNVEVSKSNIKDSPVTFTISLPSILREAERKLEISIDLGQIDLARELLDEKMRRRSANETNHDFKVSASGRNAYSDFKEKKIDQITEQTLLSTADKDDDETLTCLISEVFEPNDLETSEAANTLENINNNVGSNYNQPVYSEKNKAQRRPMKKVKSSNTKLVSVKYYTPTNSIVDNKSGTKQPVKGDNTSVLSYTGKRRGRKPKPRTNNVPRKKSKKSDLAKYVESFSSNCDPSTPASALATPAVDFVTTQNFVQQKQISGQPTQIVYVLNNNGEICQVIPSVNVGSLETNNINNEELIVNTPFDIVNYIDNNTNSDVDNGFSHVLDGNNCSPVNIGSNMLDMTNVTIMPTVQVNSSEQLVQFPKEKIAGAVNHQFIDRPVVTRTQKLHHFAVTDVNALSIPMVATSMPPHSYGQQDGVLDLSRKKQTFNCPVVRIQNSKSPQGDCVPIDLSIKGNIGETDNRNYANNGNQSFHNDDDVDNDAHDQSDEILRQFIENSSFDCKPETNQHSGGSHLTPEAILDENESYKAALDMPSLDDDELLALNQPNLPLENGPDKSPHNCCNDGLLMENKDNSLNDSATLPFAPSQELSTSVSIGIDSNTVFDNQNTDVIRDQSYYNHACSIESANPGAPPIMSLILPSDDIINDILNRSSVECNNGKKDDNGCENSRLSLENIQIEECGTHTITDKEAMDGVAHLRRENDEIESRQEGLISIISLDDSFVTFERSTLNFEALTMDESVEANEEHLTEENSNVNKLKNISNNEDIIRTDNIPDDECMQGIENMTALGELCGIDYTPAKITIPPDEQSDNVANVQKNIDDKVKTNSPLEFMESLEDFHFIDNVDHNGNEELVDKPPTLISGNIVVKDTSECISDKESEFICTTESKEKEYAQIEGLNENLGCTHKPNENMGVRNHVDEMEGTDSEPCNFNFSPGQTEHINLESGKTDANVNTSQLEYARMNTENNSPTKKYKKLPVISLASIDLFSRNNDDCNEKKHISDKMKNTSNTGVCEQTLLDNKSGGMHVANERNENPDDNSKGIVKISQNKRARCDESGDIDKSAEKRTRFEHSMMSVDDNEENSTLYLDINFENAESIGSSKATNTVNDDIDKLNHDEQRVHLEDNEVSLKASFTVTQNSNSKIEPPTTTTTTTTMTKVKDVCSTTHQRKEDVPVDLFDIDSLEILINSSQIHTDHDINNNSNAEELKTLSDNMNVTEITEEESDEANEEGTVNYTVNHSSYIENVIKDMKNGSVIDSSLKTGNDLEETSTIITEKANNESAGDMKELNTIRKDTLLSDLSVLELENTYNHACLDFDDQMEDDVLSLATSCFNSPEDDRYSLSTLNDDKEDSGIQENGTEIVLSTKVEPEPWEATFQSGQKLSGKCETIIDPISMLTKFKIPKLVATHTTANAVQQHTTNVSPSKKKIDLNKMTRTVQNVCAVPPLTLKPPPIQFSATSSKAFQSRNDLLSLTVIRNEIACDETSLRSSNYILNRGQLAGRGGEAINRSIAVYDIVNVFGPNCLPFLVDKCPVQSSLQHNHQFRDPALVQIALEGLRRTELNIVYKFMFNHAKLFQRYFFVFCSIYAKRNNRTKLLNMVYDCERQSGCAFLMRNIFYSLQTCGLSKINACRQILNRSKNKSSATIDTLVGIIFESDWAMFCDHLERFAEVPHYSFRINLLNEMAGRVLRTKDRHLSSVVCKCLLTLNQEDYQLVQRTPDLIALLELMKDGKA